MRGINFGWLALWYPSPDWLCRKLEVCDVCQALRWSRRAWGRGVRAVPRLCIEYPGVCSTTEEKSQKSFIQGNRRALGWSVPNAIRLVDLAIAGDGLDRPAAHAALGSHVRWRGQPSVSVSIYRVISKTEIIVIFIYKTLPNPYLKLYSGAQCLHKRCKAPSRTFRGLTDRCKIIFDSTASVEVTLDYSLWLWCTDMVKPFFFVCSDIDIGTKNKATEKPLLICFLYAERMM